IVQVRASWPRADLRKQERIGTAQRYRVAGEEEPVDVWDRGDWIARGRVSARQESLRGVDVGRSIPHVGYGSDVEFRRAERAAEGDFKSAGLGRTGDPM